MFITQQNANANVYNISNVYNTTQGSSLNVYNTPTVFHVQHTDLTLHTHLKPALIFCQHQYEMLIITSISGNLG